MNLDIWKLISLYLPYNELNLNRKLSGIYDESWFKDKLNYPNIKSINSWEWLYKRSLKSGQIFRYNENKNTTKKLLSINAIKISEMQSEWILSLNEGFEDYNVYMILTFNGDLYSFYKSRKYISDLTLIDTNVIDINDNTYIKNNEWYVFPERTNDKISDKILVTSSDTNFLAIASDGNNIATITEDYFYCYNINNGNKRVYNWPNNVNLIYSVHFLIQKSDGSLIIYDYLYDISTKLEIGGIVKNIYPGCIKFLDNSIKIISKQYSTKQRDDLIFRDINENQLTNSIYNKGDPLLLINNNVYSTRNLISNEPKIVLIYENVKNIFGTFTNYFII
jgi:hypothetical protein